MKFYALVLWRLRGVVPRRLQLVYLGSGDVLTYDPGEADLLAVERKLLALWEAIQAGDRRRATGGRGRAGCAAGATTRRCVRNSAALPRPTRCRWPRLAAATVPAGAARRPPESRRSGR